jgi:glycosyltransferase domain-containing protein
MKKLNKLAIIIPSYNRKAYLKKQISYWSSTPFKIFILDGGTDNFKKEEILKLPNNIKYFVDSSDIFIRIVKIKKYISSKYILLLCDDEFYIKSTLKKIITFLDFNKKYFSSSSLPLGFIETRGNLIYKEVYPEIKKRIKHPENEEPFKRLDSYLKFQYNIYMYSIMRSNIFFECVKLVNKCKFNVYALQEVLFGIRLSLASKHKILNKVGWLRNSGNPPIRYKGIFFDPSKRIGDWWRVDKEKNNRKFFIKILCKELKLKKNFYSFFEKKFSENFKRNSSKKYYLSIFFRNQIAWNLIQCLKNFFQNYILNINIIFKKKNYLDNGFNEIKKLFVNIK